MFKQVGQTLERLFLAPTHSPLRIGARLFPQLVPTAPTQLSPEDLKHLEEQTQKVPFFGQRLPLRAERALRKPYAPRVARV